MKFEIRKEKVTGLRGWYIREVTGSGPHDVVFLWKDLTVHDVTGWNDHAWGEAPGYYSSKEEAHLYLEAYSQLWLFTKWAVRITKCFKSDFIRAEDLIAEFKRHILTDLIFIKPFAGVKPMEKTQIQAQIEQNKRDQEKLREEQERLEKELVSLDKVIRVGDRVEVQDNSAVIGVCGGKYHTCPSLTNNIFTVLELGLKIAEGYDKLTWPWKDLRICDALITDGFDNYWFINSLYLRKI